MSAPLETTWVQGPPRSRPNMRMVAAAAAICGVFAGAYALGRSGSASTPKAEPPLAPAVARTGAVIPVALTGAPSILAAPAPVVSHAAPPRRAAPAPAPRPEATLVHVIQAPAASPQPAAPVAQPAPQPVARPAPAPAPAPAPKPSGSSEGGTGHAGGAFDTSG